MAFWNVVVVSGLYHVCSLCCIVHKKPTCRRWGPFTGSPPENISEDTWGEEIVLVFCREKHYQRVCVCVTLASAGAVFPSVSLVWGGDGDGIWVAGNGGGGDWMLGSGSGIVPFCHTPVGTSGFGPGSTKMNMSQITMLMKSFRMRTAFRRRLCCFSQRRKPCLLCLLARLVLCWLTTCVSFFPNPTEHLRDKNALQIQMLWTDDLDLLA